MGKIPEDAIHWNSGDWIEWHRSAEGLDERPCSAATDEDPLARLTALQVSLLRAAKTYYVLTGDHLPIYPAMAEVNAAIHFEAPLTAVARQEAGVKLLHLPPHRPQSAVEVDLADEFDLLIVVRIRDNFAVEARAMPRSALPNRCNGSFKMSWKSMPTDR